MHGTDMGLLRVYGKIRSQEQELLSYSGSRGNTWNGVQLTIQTSSQFQVRAGAADKRHVVSFTYYDLNIR